MVKTFKPNYYKYHFLLNLTNSWDKFVL